MAAYKEEFYVKENIIGYTGDIKKNPTVYFQKKEKDGSISYGHITQNHNDKKNEGRELVHRRNGYEQGNHWVCTEKKKKEKGEKQEYEYTLLRDFKGEEQELDMLDILGKVNVKVIKGENEKIKRFHEIHVEILHGEVIHPSRTKFTAVSNTNRDKLSEVLGREDMKKIKSMYSNKDIKEEEKLQEFFSDPIKQKVSREVPTQVAPEVLDPSKKNGLTALPVKIPLKIFSTKNPKLNHLKAQSVEKKEIHKPAVATTKMSRKEKEQQDEKDFEALYDTTIAKGGSRQKEEQINRGNVLKPSQLNAFKIQPGKRQGANSKPVVASLKTSSKEKQQQTRNDRANTPTTATRRRNTNPKPNKGGAKL